MPPRKTNRFWASVCLLLRFGMWISIFTFLFSFLGPRFYVAELLTSFRFQFLVLFAVLMLLSRVAQVGKLLLVCLVIVTGWAGWESGRLYLPVQQPAAGETTVRVMSYNVLDTNWDFQASIDEVHKHDPDIVAVLEYANMWHQACDALNEAYPYQHRDPRWHGYGIAIFSKIPIEHAESIPLTEEVIDNPLASVTVRVDGQLLRVVASHVMSPTKQSSIRRNC